MKIAYRVCLFLMLVCPLSVHCFDPKTLDFSTLSNDPCTEHVVAIDRLFSLIEVRNFLEFGMGKGTKYFLDRCEKVTSLEISIESRAADIDPWYAMCIESYRDYPHWTPLFYRGSSVLDYYNSKPALDYFTEHKKYPAAFFDQYQGEIEAVCHKALENASFDVAFVDPGIFTRADIVNQLLGKVDIVIAHDTHNSIYGWSRLLLHQGYERIDYFSAFGGTSFWIKKTNAELIDSLKKELNSISLQR